MEIRLEDGRFIIGEYVIAGEYYDGYTVWKRDGETETPVYKHVSLEHCIVWCLNS